MKEKQVSPSTFYSSNNGSSILASLRFKENALSKKKDEEAVYLKRISELVSSIKTYDNALDVEREKTKRLNDEKNEAISSKEKMREHLNRYRIELSLLSLSLCPRSVIAFVLDP